MRWNLKEAAGKALARRTEIIAYEAFKSDKEANIFKVRYLYRRLERICGGHKREGGCALPGEISSICQVLPTPRGVGMDGEKSPMNGHGPWWNAGTSHMNQAFPKRFFDRLGLVSLIDQLRRLQRVS